MWKTCGGLKKKYRLVHLKKMVIQYNHYVMQKLQILIVLKIAAIMSCTSSSWSAESLLRKLNCGKQKLWNLRYWVSKFHIHLTLAHVFLGSPICSSRHLQPLKSLIMHMKNSCPAGINAAWRRLPKGHVSLHQKWHKRNVQLKIEHLLPICNKCEHVTTESWERKMCAV